MWAWEFFRLSLSRERTYIDESYAVKAQNRIDYDTCKEVINTLPLHSQVILLSIVFHHESKLDKITTRHVINTYQSLCQKLNAVPLTNRRISDLIAELDLMGIIQANVVSLGRYGKTRLINVLTPLSQTKNILLSNEYFSQIPSLKPETLKLTTQSKLL